MARPICENEMAVGGECTLMSSGVLGGLGACSPGVHLPSQPPLSFAHCVRRRCERAAFLGNWLPGVVPTPVVIGNRSLSLSLQVVTTQRETSH